MASETRWMTFLCRMAFSIWAGEPAAEISPLTKTLVSMTKRGRSFALTTPVFSNRPHRLRDGSLNLCDRDAAVGGVDFGDRFPRIDVPESPSNDESLKENS